MPITAGAERQKLTQIRSENASALAALRETQRHSDVEGAKRREAQATEALQAFLFESAVDPAAGDDSRKEGLAREVREARDGLQEAQRAARRIPGLQERVSELEAAEQALVAQVVEAEGRLLATTFHEHSKVALRAYEAAKRLALWLTINGQPQRATALNEALKAFPDPAAKAAHDRDLGAFGSAWFAMPPALVNDPQASGPAPEEFE